MTKPFFLHISMTSEQMDTFFSQSNDYYSYSDPLDMLDQDTDDILEDKELAKKARISELLSKISEFFPKLPPLEADILNLYFYHKQTQDNIAYLIGIRQPSVCYRLDKALERIKFLFNLPAINVDTMEQDLINLGTSKEDAFILTYFYTSTSQTKTAKKTNKSQGQVRHKIIKWLGTYDKVEEAKLFHDGIKYVLDHLNILTDNVKVKEIIDGVRVHRIG